MDRPRWSQDRSFIRYRDAAGPYGYGESYGGAGREGVYPGFGGGGSFVYVDGTGSDRASDGAAPSAQPARTADGRKIEIVDAGGAKIIRISPPSGRIARTPASYAPPKRAIPLEPWSEGWERYCQRAHRDFDSERGTYTTEDGRMRFCTGD